MIMKNLWMRAERPSTSAKRSGPTPWISSWNAEALCPKRKEGPACMRAGTRRSMLKCLQHPHLPRLDRGRLQCWMRSRIHPARLPCPASIGTESDEISQITLTTTRMNTYVHRARPPHIVKEPNVSHTLQTLEGKLAIVALSTSRICSNKCLSSQLQVIGNTMGTATFQNPKRRRMDHLITGAQQARWSGKLSIAAEQQWLTREIVFRDIESPRQLPKESHVPDWASVESQCVSRAQRVTSKGTEQSSHRSTAIED